MQSNLVSRAAVVVYVLSAFDGAQAQVRYVDDSATGANSGLSWCDAFVRLQDALAAPGVTEIRVAQGLYRPDRTAAAPGGSGDREATFMMRNFLILSGGYAGCGAADPNARDPELYPTILSGDLAGNDAVITTESDCTTAGGVWYGFLCDKITNNGENSYHVVSSMDNDVTARLEGFIVSGGNSNGAALGPVPESDDQGAAVNIYHGSPRLVDCVFEHNRTDNHGAVNDHGGATMTGCEFRYNFATRWGGAMHNHQWMITTLNGCNFHHNATAGTDGGGGAILAQGTIRPNNCTFSENRSATKGGAIYVQNAARVNLAGSTFTSNSAGTNGGGLYAGPGAFPSTVDQTSFLANFAERGAGMYIEGYTDVSITGCTVSNNQASIRGGGLYLAGADGIVADTVFQGNSAGSSYGGGAVVSGGSGNFTNCDFLQNSAVTGGGVYSFITVSEFDGCSFVGNHASSIGQGGGAIYTSGYSTTDSFLTLRHSTVRDNTTDGEGAGIYSYTRSHVTLSEVDFIENVALRNGGGFQSYIAGQASISHCRFIGNAANYGAGVYLYRDDPTFVNCLFSGNAATTEGGAIIASRNNLSFINCTIAANTAGQRGAGASMWIQAGEAGTGNLNFVNSIFWDNSDASGSGQAAQIWPEESAAPVIQHSIVAGWDGTLAGSDNLDQDPMFIDAAGPDGVVGTEDDDLHLIPVSPAVNSGDNAALPSGVVSDLDGNQRVSDLTVDMGAFEVAGTCPNAVCGPGENRCNCPDDCGAPAPSETACTNLQDDDCDSFVDCDDTDCEPAPSCQPPPIPAVSQWGALVLALLVAAAGTIVMSRVRKTQCAS